MGRRLVALLTVITALTTLATLPGCNVVGWVAQGMSEDPESKITIEPQYLGMTGKRVAVLVATDDRATGRYPNAALRIAKQLTAQLQADVTDVTVMNPEATIAWQEKNRYWSTYTYKDIAAALNVDRLLVVDIATYTTHPTGNRHLWQGIIRGRVSVTEADGETPNRTVFSEDVTAQYPPDEPVGVLDSDDGTIQLGMVKLFAYKVSARFRDHDRD